MLQSDSWTTLDPIVQAKRNGEIDLNNYDYVLNIWDDIQQTVGSSGTAHPYKEDITIDGTTYREKSQMAKYLKPYDLDDQCFYKEQIYKNLDRCYANPIGENLKHFEGVVFHEFLHTKQLAVHSFAKYCDNVLLGQCHSNYYNMFDALSSARFYGNSLNAHDKHEIKWLADDDILSLQPNTGSHEITLHHLNSQDNGKKAVKISYQTLMGSDIWLEFRQPAKLDYGLFNKVFDKVTNGLLIYEDHLLLDATPQTKARELIKEYDVGISDRFSFDPLGLNITINNVDPIAGTIRFRVDLGSLKPTRNQPIITHSGCGGPFDCQVKKGGSFSTSYEAMLSDLGYGDQLNSPWSYSLTGLPKGIRWGDDGIKRQFTSDPSLYSRSPHTFITFSADYSVQPATYSFKMRFINPEDKSKYVDLTQLLTVVD